MSAGFERVYQGGHHDVYCNGGMHVWLTGPQFGNAQLVNARFENPPAMIRTGRCDCSKFHVRPEVVPA